MVKVREASKHYRERFVEKYLNGQVDTVAPHDTGAVAHLSKGGTANDALDDGIFDDDAFDDEASSDDSASENVATSEDFASNSSNVNYPVRGWGGVGDWLESFADQVGCLRVPNDGIF